MTSFVPLLKDSTSSTGTGNITTIGAVVGFQSLSAVGPVGTTFDYMIRKDGSAEWEEGVGTLLSTTSFSRAPTSSSNGGSLVNFSAGTKDVIIGPTAYRVRKADNGSSPQVVYLSNYVKSDTDLRPYNQQAGVDQRAAVQKVLDLAKTLGSLHLVWDVKITLANVPNSDGDTLLISSNTTIVALPGCGALQAAGSKGDMLKNANPTTNQNNNFASIVDENITIDGGIWHGNREGQTVKMDVFRFSGVRNLRTVNYTIYRPSGMCFRLINTDGHKNENYTLDQGVDILTAQNSVSINTDGMHYHGPARAIRDTNGRILNCGDDSYALNADDAWGAGTFTGRFDNVYGPITDVRVKDLYFTARYFGVRILSGNSRVDQVFFHNGTGASQGSSFRIDNYLTPSQTRAAGPGNVGLVEVDGWDVKTGMVDFSWGQMAMEINCRIEQLSLRNIVKRDFNNAYFPAIRFGERYQGDQLVVDYRSWNYTGGTYLTEQIDFATGASVGQADIKMRVRAASAVNGYPLRIRSGVTMLQGEVRGGQINFTGMVQNDSSTTAAFVDNSKATAAAAPNSTYTAQGGTGGSTGWNENASDPTTLSYTGPVSGVVRSIKKNTNDAFGGNVLLSADITVSGSVNPNHHDALFVRGGSSVPWSGVQNCYFIDLQFNNSGTVPTLSLNRVVNGTQTTLYSNPVDLVPSVKYTVKLTAKGSSISISVQRASDGFYVQSTGAFASTPGNVITVTDTTVPAASGEWGFYSFADGSSSASFTNIAIAAAP